MQWKLTKDARLKIKQYMELTMDRKGEKGKAWFNDEELEKLIKVKESSLECYMNNIVLQKLITHIILYRIKVGSLQTMTDTNFIKHGKHHNIF